MTQKNKKPTDQRVAHRSDGLFSLLAIVGPLLVVAVVLFKPTAAAAATMPTKGDLLYHLNVARLSNGLPMVRLDAALDRAAVRHARNMLQKNYVAHTSPTGRTFWYWLGNSRRRFSALGENLARGFQSGEQTMTAWLTSPGHRRNLLNPHFTSVGTAVVRGRISGQTTTLIIQYFGADRSASSVIASAGTAKILSVLKPTP